MTVDIFDLDTFQKVIPNAVQCGVEYNEYTFSIPLDHLVSIHVRSSISPVSGKSDGAGEDSIRLYLYAEDRPLGNIVRRVNRIPGWELRLQIAIQELQDYRKKFGDCPTCLKPLGIFKVEKPGVNHGRIFAKCPRCGTGFSWFESTGQPFFASTPVTENTVLEFMAEPEPEPKPELKLVEPNSEQSQVIYASSSVPCRVLAGAGSGKTFCIKYRYKHFVDDVQIPPHKIVAVTFSAKMAQELKDKIVAVCPQISGTVAERQICTIHALCLRMLRESYPRYAAYDIAKDWQIKKEVQTALAELCANPELRPAWEETWAYIQTSKMYGYSLSNCGTFFANALELFYADLLTSVRVRVDNALRSQKLWTYADMLLDCELALEDAAFLRFWQDRFSYLIVDESQDTNMQSMRILTKLFSHTNFITMVGDTDQLLYRFAGATPEANLLDGFTNRYPQGQMYKLSTNYRSTQRVVQAGLEIIRHNYSDYGGVYDQRYFKQLSTPPSAPLGAEIALLSFNSPIEEAAGVKILVSKALERGTAQPDDFFIAFRTRAQGAYLEGAFALSGIPYVNTTGMSFWTLPHVATLISYLRLAHDPSNREAFANVYNVASKYMTVPWRSHPDYGAYCNHRWLNRAFLESTGTFSKAHCVREGKWRPGVEDLTSFMDGLYSALDTDLVTGIEYIIEDCLRPWILYESGQEADNEGDGGKLDDLKSVLELAAGYTLPQFLEYVDQVIQASKAMQSADWTGRVVLSTIHRLKGLERKVVIGVGISENDMTFSKAVGGLLPHTFALRPPPSTGKLPGPGAGRVEDERCLFYVLVTRAKEAVILSTISRYRGVPMVRSRFLSEIETLQEIPFQNVHLLEDRHED